MCQKVSSPLCILDNVTILTTPQQRWPSSSLCMRRLKLSEVRWSHWACPSNTGKSRIFLSGLNMTFLRHGWPVHKMYRIPLKKIWTQEFCLYSLCSNWTPNCFCILQCQAGLTSLSINSRLPSHKYSGSQLNWDLILGLPSSLTLEGWEFLPVIKKGCNKIYLILESW